MINYLGGDILEARTEAIVNTVNCVGVMGRGIALQFKRAFPQNFKAYALACKRKEVQPGRMFIFETGALDGPRYIINFPTKVHWRGKSRLEYIESGLDALVADVRQLGIQSIAIPPLGSGLGGLDWSEVRPLIDRALAELPDIDAQVYEPTAAIAGLPIHSTRTPAMTPGRAALVGLIERYLAGLMDPSITLLELHKLMYFLQSAGEPLRLRYTKAWYGPYAENLRHVLVDVEGHLVTGYSGEGDKPEIEIALVPGAADLAHAFLDSQLETRARFDRVGQLVEGFETPFGLELLATVHWVAAHDRAADRRGIHEGVYGWGHRKRQFTEDQIDLAINRLESGDWLQPVAT
jgi:O-acetyl-ADP-ribose deacetylase (regulator of RNase III)